jgi:hypothetical protein
MSKKREAKAGQRRKSRAPVVSNEGLNQHKEAIADRELWQLNNRLEELERLRKAGVLNTPFIALEALGALSGGVVNGRTEAELKTTWPQEWGHETVTVPLALLHALRAAWADYRQAPTGKTLGESFRIEGGEQGKHPMKSKLATVDNARRLAGEVESIYYQVEGEESDLRLEEAIQTVASKNGVSFEAVKEAHKKHRDYIRADLTDVGVLKGVKTSRG